MKKQMMIFALLALPTARAAAPQLQAAHFNNLEGIAFCPDGTLYVTETKTKLLHKLDKDYKSVQSWPLKSALGLLCTSKGEVYIAGYDSGQVFKLEKDGPKELTSALKGPNALAELPDGRILVSDSKGGAVYELAQDGPKALADKLIYPNGLAWIPGLGLAINSTTGQSVWVMAEAKAGAKPGKKFTGLMVPDGAALGPDGALYVAEYGRGQVVKFDAKGVKTVAAKGMTSPASLHFGKGPWGEKTLYVTSLMAKGLYKIEGLIP